MDISQAFSSFAVNDISTARQFYADVLGMDAHVEGEDAMHMLRIRLGTGSTVLVYAKGDHVPASFTVLNIPVPDVDAAVDELMAAGVQMKWYEGFGQDEKGIARGNGPTIAWFLDPAGNTIAVVDRGPDGA